MNKKQSSSKEKLFDNHPIIIDKINLLIKKQKVSKHNEELNSEIQREKNEKYFQLLKMVYQGDAHADIVAKKMDISMDEVESLVRELVKNRLMKFTSDTDAVITDPGLEYISSNDFFVEDEKINEIELVEKKKFDEMMGKTKRGKRKSKRKLKKRETSAREQGSDLGREMLKRKKDQERLRILKLKKKKKEAELEAKELKLKATMEEKKKKLEIQLAIKEGKYKNKISDLPVDIQHFSPEEKDLNHQDILEEVKRALYIADDLLINLPDEVIDEFVQSEDFEIYKKVINKYKNK